MIFKLKDINVENLSKSISEWSQKHHPKEEKEDEDDVIAQVMLGGEIKDLPEFKAAEKMSKVSIPESKAKYYWGIFEYDLQAAALAAHGLEDTKENRTTLQSIIKLSEGE